MYLLSFISFIVSALATYLLMPWLLRFCKRRGLYDIPNERKVHHNKIPRLGGVLFMPCALMGVIATIVIMTLSGHQLPNFTPATFLIVSGIFLIYLIGLLDDILGLSAKLKFLVQFVASLFLPVCNLYFNDLYGFMGIHEIPILFGYPLTIFVCLLVVNSINLIDGIDGLASGISLIALGAYTLIFFSLGATSYAIFATAIIGSVAVFFYFNMFGSVEKMTKTFMGDTGSLILGYVLSYFAMKLSMSNSAVLPYREDALLMSCTLLLIPTFDLIRVALMRLKRGESIFHPDKTHLHHKFLAVGFSMHRALVAILSLQIFFCVLNIILYELELNCTWIIALDVVLFSIVQLLLNNGIQKKK